MNTTDVKKTDNIITLEHVTFQYNKEEGTPVQVLKDISLDIQAGSFVAVLGHNGCGKSTLAKHMNAILLPSGGTVYVNGIDTRSDEEWMEVRRTVGMVFQNPDNQIVSNVVEEDVAFAPENLGVPSEEIRRRVDKALEIVGMSAYSTHRTCSPAVRNSGWPLRASSPWNPSASSWTSLPPCWTPSAGRRCWRPSSS